MMTTISPPPMANERRRFQRVLHDAECVLQYAEQSWACHVVDLSLKGCLIATPPEFVDPGASAALSVEINLGTDCKILMTASVAHRREQQIGLSCDHIDLESISNLRRLVELNIGDNSLLDREIAALVSVHAH